VLTFSQAELIEDSQITAKWHFWVYGHWATEKKTRANDGGNIIFLGNENRKKGEEKQSKWHNKCDKVGSDL